MNLFITGGLAASLATLILPAYAQDEWTYSSDRPYDVLANCLAAQMRPLYHTDPGVSAPPRKEATVRLWVRGTEHGSEPVGVFHVRALPTPGGGTGIVFKSPRPFRHFEQVKEAGRWCGRFAL